MSAKKKEDNRISLMISFSDMGEMFASKGTPEITAQSLLAKEQAVLGKLHLSNESQKLSPAIELGILCSSSMIELDGVEFKPLKPGVDGEINFPENLHVRMNDYLQLKETLHETITVLLFLDGKKTKTFEFPLTIYPPREADIPELVAAFKAQRSNDKQKDNQAAVSFYLKVYEDHSVAFAGEGEPHLIYALASNKLDTLFKSFTFLNEAAEPVPDVKIHVDFDSEIIQPVDFELGDIPAGENAEVPLSKFGKVKIAGEKLAELTEIAHCNMKATLLIAGQEIGTDEREVTIFPYDQWDGNYPLLPAYMSPNHPAVIKLMHDASDWLKDHGISPSLVGYQDTEHPERVLYQAAAIYAAIQKANIAYSNPPASFTSAQRIRLCDAVLEQHFGTCMDMTLLYASCLESIGLNSLLILTKDHIFAGVWLQEKAHLSQIVLRDASYLDKQIRNGNLAVVECTAMCSRIQANDFDKARKAAEENVNELVKEHDPGHGAVDVWLVRHAGILPMPMRVRGEDGVYRIEVDELSKEKLTKAPEKPEEVIQYDNTVKEEHISKFKYWEKKLLDLSNRNRMLNFQDRECVPLFASMAKLEDELADGNEFSLISEDLSNKSMEEAEEMMNAPLAPPPGYYDRFDDNISRHQISTSIESKRLNTVLRRLYRNNADAMAESGTSTLYIALGLLKWYDLETDGSDGSVPMYAPLVLLPVDIERKSPGSYAMRRRSEMPSFNLTLWEMLKERFGIHINGVDPLPLDEHGLDVRRIFTYVRHAVMEKPGWTVVESGFLGNFSFSDFIMWNDLRSSADIFQKNKIVDSLVQGRLTWTPEVPEDIDQDDAYIAIPADGSQLRAIKIAACGNSFVLHGPPGTGKSQTITAMIANAMAQGKTVLFVAEKKTALDVVDKRLTSIGLDPFCMELHSEKTDVRRVLSQLEKPLQISHQKNRTEEYENKLKETRELRRQLNAYGEILNQTQPCGLSLRQLIDRYEDDGESFAIPCSEEIAKEMTAEKLEENQNSLKAYFRAAEKLSAEQIEALTPIHIKSYVMHGKFAVQEHLHKRAEALKQYRLAAEKIIGHLEMSMPKTHAEWEQFERLVQNIPDAQYAAPAEEEGIFKRIRELAETLKENQAKEEKLLENWNAEFLKMDMKALEGELKEANEKFSMFRKKAVRQVAEKIQKYSKKSVDPDTLSEQFAAAASLQEGKRKAEELRSKLPEIAGKLAENPGKIDEAEKAAAVLREAFEKAPKLKGILQTEEEKLKEEIAEFEAAAEALSACESDTASWYEIDTKPFEDDWMDGQIRFCEKAPGQLDYLQEWSIYDRSARKCLDAGLEKAMEAYRNGRGGEEVNRAYEKGVYAQLISLAMAGAGKLKEFNGISFAEKIEHFKQADSELTELTREEIYSKLARNLPSITESIEVGRELNLLRKAITGSQKIYIRSLFEQIPHILRRLCPCMLMSPMSVAQYIPADSEQFDLVIFDEASQIPTCRAVGALARAKDAVIVGDPKQMPPTNFFETGAEQFISAEKLQNEDLDSVLDDCLALGMPSCYLQWHYRSKHESLIRFSNENFYGNRMFTFPSANDRESKVRLVHVKGTYAKSVNPAEAKAIVKEVIRRYRSAEERDKSIGIVTFNIKQRDYIESLLQKEFENNSKFDAWAHGGKDHDRDELFVKNLENVQGDERDVILFSITYGPDEHGKVNQNFGPINRDGGDKRLNVAFSRARYEMVVFSTMTPEQVRADDGNAGKTALYRFLKMAKEGTEGSRPAGQQAEDTDGIAKAICEKLRQAGYETQTHIGHSSFQVDIGVVNPYDPDDYLLGIMLDGDSYQLTKNARDRELSQPALLKQLGWNIYRIWTMDWWDSSRREMEKLLKVLEGLKTEAEKNQKPEKVEIVTTEEIELAPGGEEEYEQYVQYDPDPIKPEAPNEPVKAKPVKDKPLPEEKKPEAEDVLERIKDVHYSTVPYETYTCEPMNLNAGEFMDAANKERLTECIRGIVETEGPISHPALMKNLYRIAGISRSGNQLNTYTEKLIAQLRFKSTRQAGVKYYWPSGVIPEAYSVFRTKETREPDEVCKFETKNAVAWILQEQGPMKKEELIRKLTELFGFSRCTKRLEDSFNDAIAAARGLKVVVREKNDEYNLVSREKDYTDTAAQGQDEGELKFRAGTNETD